MSDHLTGGESIHVIADSLIQTELVEKLKKAGVSEIKDMILGSISEISQRSHIPESDLRSIRKLLSEKISLNCSLGNLHSLLSSSPPLHRKLSTGSACLDSVLGVASSIQL